MVKENIVCLNQPTNEEINNALKGDIKRLWELISTLEGNKEFMNIRQQVKLGINVMFSIEPIVRGYVEEYPDSHHVKIRGYNKYDLNEYWDEIRAREKLMKDLLREIYDEGNQKEMWKDEN